MNTVAIRPIQAADNQPMAEVIRGCFEEFNAPRTGSVYDDPVTDNLYHTFQQTPQSSYWVVTDNDQVMGGAGIFPSAGLPAGICELVKIYLHPAARGRGLARQLMQTCIDAARSRGYHSIYIESFPQFATAVSLYEKMGFTHIGAPMGETGHTSCSIWMLLRL
jgi:putative acetyltransferase